MASGIYRLETSNGPIADSTDARSILRQSRAKSSCYTSKVTVANSPRSHCNQFCSQTVFGWPRQVSFRTGTRGNDVSIVGTPASHQRSDALLTCTRTHYGRHCKPVSAKSAP